MAAKLHDDVKVVHRENLSATDQQRQRAASLDQNVEGRCVLPYANYQEAIRNC